MIKIKVTLISAIETILRNTRREERLLVDKVTRNGKERRHLRASLQQIIAESSASDIVNGVNNKFGASMLNNYAKEADKLTTITNLFFKHCEVSQFETAALPYKEELDVYLKVLGDAVKVAIDLTFKDMSVLNADAGGFISFFGNDWRNSSTTRVLLISKANDITIHKTEGNQVYTPKQIKAYLDDYKDTPRHFRCGGKESEETIKKYGFSILPYDLHVWIKEDTKEIVSPDVITEGKETYKIIPYILPNMHQEDF